jgi:hypothetical protein
MKFYACCFNDEEIKQFIISSASQEEKCINCNSISKYVQINELLDFFADFLSVFTKDDDGIPLYTLIQQDWNIFSANCNCQDVLNEVMQLLNIDLTAMDSVIYIPKIKECIEYWDFLKEDLKWNTRFLTNTERLTELEWDRLFKTYSTIDKDRNLYRARIHKDGSKNPLGIDKITCPPKEETVAGRANPQGIPYLYLSNEIDTTLYETRVSYLDIVSIGIFRIKNIDELEIVDFTLCQSPFSDDNANMVDFVKGKLLRQRISADLSKPIRRFDSELEYVPTQFICEYIRKITGAQGIQFNSSLHKGGVNVVLFSKENVQCVDEQIHQVIEIGIKSLKIV